MKEMEELRGKTLSDLKALTESTREELFKMRFAATTEPVDHPNKIQEARRRIARIETLIKQRDLEAAKSAQPQPTGKK
jgi:large subunit ribosomal protein L29